MHLTKRPERLDLLQHDNVVSLALAFNGAAQTGIASPNDNHAGDIRG